MTTSTKSGPLTQEEVVSFDVEADATYEVVVDMPMAPPEIVVEVTPKPEAIDQLRERKREYMRAWRKAQGAKDKPGPERSAPCGSRSGYKAHLKYGEPTCTPCREAHQAYQADLRRRKNLQKTA